MMYSSPHRDELFNDEFKATDSFLLFLFIFSLCQNTIITPRTTAWCEQAEQFYGVMAVVLDSPHRYLTMAITRYYRLGPIWALGLQSDWDTKCPLIQMS